MKTNACKICKKSVLNDGICLGLAINSDYSKLEPIDIGNPLLDNWIVENSVHDAKIVDDNCNCESFIKIENHHSIEILG